MMQGDAETRRARGRLSREALIKLCRVLETYFDNVRREGVPDRFKQLLEQYDERRVEGQSAEGQPLHPVEERKDKGTN